MNQSQLGMDRIKKIVNGLVTRYAIILITFFMIIVCSFLKPTFLTVDNFLNVSRQVSIYALLAFAESILIISGNIDLAAGSTLCLSGIMSIPVYQATGNLVLAVLVSIACGVFCNLISGILVAYGSLPSFVATLAMQMAARGGVLVFTDGKTITQVGSGFRFLGQGYVGKIPIPVIIMFLCTLILYVLLDKTRTGRNFFALGGNSEAARASGINIKSQTILAFLFAGVFIGLAGFVFTSRMNSGIPNAASGYEGQGIAAAVIGGIGFSGGTGSAGGALIGAFVMGILSNILNLMGINSYIQQIINGSIIMLAVGLDIQARKRKLSA
jgi:inositol transport system permease protein